jgi:hypothetical protein
MSSPADSAATDSGFDGVVDEGDAEVPVSGDGCGSGFERHAVVLLELVRGFAPSR